MATRPLTEQAREVARGRIRRRASFRARLGAEFLLLPLLTDVAAGVGLALLLHLSPLFAALAVAMACLLHSHAGLYRQRLTLSALDELPAIVGRVVVACTVATVADLLLEDPIRPTQVLVLATLWSVAATCLRGIAYVLVRQRRRQRRHTRRTLIVGAGKVGNHLARNLHIHADYGLIPVGLVDDDPYIDLDRDPRYPLTPVLGGQGDLVRLVLEHDVQTVIFAFSSAREADLVDLIRSCDKVDCEIYIVPRLFEFNTRARGDDFVWGLPVAKLARPAFRSPTRWVKRLLDLTLSAVALVALSPVMAVCAVLAKLETGGVLFRQQRIGIDGKPFDLLKFQSLKPRDETEAQTRWNVANDDRLGPIGRFLRSTSLDELPQLWNVMVGEMSLVGPRPERPHFVREFSRTFPRYSARSRVAAGLTGWAQIHALRGDTSISERASFDNYYIEHWSAWGDVKILLRTVPAVVFRHGR